MWASGKGQKCSQWSICSFAAAGGHLLFGGGPVEHLHSRGPTARPSSTAAGLSFSWSSRTTSLGGHANAFVMASPLILIANVNV